MPIDQDILETSLEAATRRLLDARTSAGHWEGELSTSALSTATSVCALALVKRERQRSSSADDEDLGFYVSSAIAWLVQNQNADGGYGDTTSSPSNISTTVLVWAALNFASGTTVDAADAIDGAETWITNRAGGLSAVKIGTAIDAVYGKDKTFSVPILTMCALSGRFGTGRDAWVHVRALPFEFAACPHQLFKWIGLPVVSYALPALIAIGQVCHHRRPTRNPVACFFRWLTRERTLRVLQKIQPASGGFLEAAPLTGFVLMSLASIGRAESKTGLAAMRFLTNTVRPDGSWPIDTNLATWVTTLAINALESNPDANTAVLTQSDRERLVEYLLNQRYDVEHPYTHAAPGGWAWTHLSGGVPDADDTAGALLALHTLLKGGSFDETVTTRVTRAAEAGVKWLIDLQNRDGGIPTFCRGWGKLPFDQSTPDLTAHALRAWNCWSADLSGETSVAIRRAATRAIDFLSREQRPDGSWIPLWFGNQQTSDQTSPLYGTSRVVCAASLESLDIDPATRERWVRSRGLGYRWIIASQNKDGGWGGGSGARSTVEETALALDALAATLDAPDPSIALGAEYLSSHTQDGTAFEASPIGLYFAKLWYSEQLYPLVFTVAALNRVANSHRRNE